MRVQHSCVPTVVASFNRCGASLSSLVKRIWSAVADCLRSLFLCGPARLPRHPAPNARAPQLHRQPHPDAGIPQLNSHLEIAPPVLAPDVPQSDKNTDALAKVRRVLQRNDCLLLKDTENLTPRDFINLSKEFPWKKAELIQRSIEWAKGRSIRIDPAHPFFEIFEALLKSKDELGGAGESSNYRDYELPFYFSGAGGLEYHTSVDPFLYKVYSILGFQELNRPDCREWIQLIDNKKNTFLENPAFQFARALGKIFVYPSSDPRGDTRDKILHGMRAIWFAYQAGKSFGVINEFFRSAFKQEFCFDARVNTFQNFTKACISHPDFNVDIGSGHTLEHRVAEHFRVFTNLQINKLCLTTTTYLGYTSLQLVISQFGDEGIPAEGHRFVNEDGQAISEEIRYKINADVHRLYQDFLKVENFAAYLTQNQNPLRELDKPRQDIEHYQVTDRVLPKERWERILRDLGLWPDVWDRPPATV